MKECDDLYTLVKHLRTRCPWDKEQDFQSMRKNVREEAEELCEAITKEDWANVCEELGDTFFNLLFVANLAEEAGHFTLKDALNGSHEKMVRRHPHVFGDIIADTPEAALKAFLDAKNKEKSD